MDEQEREYRERIAWYAREWDVDEVILAESLEGTFFAARLRLMIAVEKLSAEIESAYEASLVYRLVRRIHMWGIWRKLARLYKGW